MLRHLYVGELTVTEVHDEVDTLRFEAFRLDTGERIRSQVFPHACRFDFGDES